jgi:hypothetical protein
LDGFFGTTSIMENGYEIYNVEFRSLCRAGSLKTAATELAKYKLDLVAQCS